MMKSWWLPLWLPEAVWNHLKALCTIAVTLSPHVGSVFQLGLCSCCCLGGSPSSGTLTASVAPSKSKTRRQEFMPLISPSVEYPATSRDEHTFHLWSFDELTHIPAYTHTHTEDPYLNLFWCGSTQIYMNTHRFLASGCDVWSAHIHIHKHTHTRTRLLSLKCWWVHGDTHS